LPSRDLRKKVEALFADEGVETGAIRAWPLAVAARSAARTALSAPHLHFTHGHARLLACCVPDAHPNPLCRSLNTKRYGSVRSPCRMTWAAKSPHCRGGPIAASAVSPMSLRSERRWRKCVSPRHQDTFRGLPGWAAWRRIIGRTIVRRITVIRSLVVTFPPGGTGRWAETCRPPTPRQNRSRPRAPPSATNSRACVELFSEIREDSPLQSRPAGVRSPPAVHF